MLYQAANALEADHQQKVVMKFAIRDKQADQLMVAHQAFVRLTPIPATGDEIVYVAEADNSNHYKFELVSLQASKAITFFCHKQLLPVTSIDYCCYSWSLV